MFELEDRVALVTGAGQGVGAEIARLLAERGAAVAVNDLYGERASQVVDEIRTAGGRAEVALADVGDHAAVEKMVAGVRDELGEVDILVNNAGLPVGDGFVIRPFEQTTPEIWEPWLRVSLYGSLHCSRAVVGGMKARGWGRIITISSDAGLQGTPDLVAYSAAKAGVMGMTRALARELGGDGITCNCIALGLMERDTYAPEFPLEEALRGYPIARMGRADDVAPAVLYLASDQASWVTGQVLAVNGGANAVR